MDRRSNDDAMVWTVKYGMADTYYDFEVLICSYIHPYYVPLISRLFKNLS